MLAVKNPLANAGDMRDMGFSRPEYWSRLPCPPPGDLSDPGIEPMSLALAGGFYP